VVICKCVSFFAVCELVPFLLCESSYQLCATSVSTVCAISQLYAMKMTQAAELTSNGHSWSWSDITS